MTVSPEENVAWRNLMKKELRKRMRGVRKALPAAAVAQRSAMIIEHLLALSAWKNAQSVALFWPIPGRNEVDLRWLFAQALAAGKRVAFPVQMQPPDRFDLAFVTAEHEMEERGAGFSEPSPEAPRAAPGSLDVIIVPALALDPRGHRIGYGIGFYDHLLPRYAPPATTVGVAFDFQLIVEAPNVETDIPVATIVTDQRVLVAQADAPNEASGAAFLRNRITLQ